MSKCKIHGRYKGKVCGFCAIGNRIDAMDRAGLQQKVEFLTKRNAELSVQLEGKPAYHCPKCGDWFSEDKLE